MKKEKGLLQVCNHYRSIFSKSRSSLIYPYAGISRFVNEFEVL